MLSKGERRAKPDVNTVVGICGMMCSGKDTIAQVLINNGYIKVSISEDVLKPVLTALKLKSDRLNYIKLGKALKNYRKDALAFLTHSLMNKGEDLKYVIPNIMTFEEARYFKEQSDIKFILIKASAELMTRYERGIKRADEKDVNDLKKFKDLDIKNLTSTGLKELMHAKLEDYNIENNGTLKELETKVRIIIQELKS